MEIGDITSLQLEIEALSSQQHKKIGDCA